MLEIDGSYLEGGGQILRTSLSLSCILKTPFRIKNIRANRPKKGLLNQHLTAVNSLAKICGARVEGNTLGSTELNFEPGEILGGSYEFDIGSAGSVTLLMQSIIPPLLYAKEESKVTITGGTHVMKSPSYEYFERCFLPNIAKFGANVSSELVRPGFYPQGGGKVVLTVKPSTLKRYDFLDYGKLVGEFAYIVCSNLPSHVSEREERFFKSSKKHNFNVTKKNFYDCVSTGNSVTLVSEFERYCVGADGLGQVGKPAEKVARDVLMQYEEELSGALDSNMVDQLLIYVALVGGGKLRYNRLSDHAKTNMYVISQFTGRSFHYEEGLIEY